MIVRERLFFDKKLTKNSKFNCYFLRYVRKYLCADSLSKLIFTEYMFTCACFVENA